MYIYIYIYIITSTANKQISHHKKLTDFNHIIEIYIVLNLIFTIQLSK